MTILRTLTGGAALSALVAASPRALADCYVDSQGGNDSNSGSSETDAVQSQDAIGSGCDVVRYKRGSVFNEAVRIVQGATTYTNYGDTSSPLPQFVVPHTTNSGSIVSSFQGGITIDGLYMAGSKGDGTMSGLIGGVCLMLGSNSQVLNSEITNCDIGMMLSGTGSLIQGNYIHDLTMAVDGDTSVDPNAVGGAEGIFINGSNNEVSYNTFVNCTSTAEWTGGSCDGGATEVAVGAGETVTGVKVHHNFSYNNCGFFEVSSMAGGTKGTFADSEFYYNVHVDGGWMMLLQVNNTDLTNIRWDNNTIVQHAGSTNSGMLTTVFTGTSSGVSGGALASGAVSMTNNLIIFDGVSPFGDVIDPAITQTTNLIIDAAEQDPGVANLAGSTAEDYDLTEASPAIDQGTAVAGHTQDFLNRTVPNGVTDIGAFEYGAEQGTEGPDAPDVPEPSTDTGTGTDTDTGTGSATETSTDSATGTGTDATTATPTVTTDGETTCPEGFTLCGDNCYDVSADEANCGTCGNACPAGQQCGSGVCSAASTCQAPLVQCGTACVDTAADPANCGTCGAACPSGQVCSLGRCTASCGPGLTQCEQSCVALSTDLLNCGTCGTSCLLGQSCVSGQCTGEATGGSVASPMPSGGALTAVEEDGGCGCTAPGSSRTRFGAVLGAAFGLIALGVRRRPGSAARV